MFLQAYSIPAKQVIKKDMYFATIEDDFKSIFNYLIENNKKEVLVIKDENLIGILTINDIQKIAGKDLSQIVVEDTMIKNITWAGPEEALENIRTLMIKNNIGRMPILSKGKVIGIIREENIRDCFYKGVEEAELAIDHIFDSIHEAVCVLDNKGRVIIWNENSELLYGLKEEEIKGKYLKDYFPEAIDLKVFKTMESVKNIYYSPKEGYHVIISASPIIINDKLYGVVSTEQDVSEIEKLEKQLKTSREKLHVLEKQIKGNSLDGFSRIIGHSKIIIDKIDIAKQIAPTNVSILLTGESGTGKEEFAKAIHNDSKLSGMFVPVNCSAIPSELFESEFFGYEEGAFTGARKGGKTGFFEQAKDGTLFLDEIGDMAVSMQVKLLRVLQDKKVKKVGGENLVPVNVRIISATNKDLLTMIREESFREELYYRINVVEIKLPELQERKEDIVLFVNYFLKEICIENNKRLLKIDNEVMDFLVDYHWKGNIRELKNAVEYMAIMCKEDIITKDLIPKYIMEDEFDSIKKKSLSSMDLNQSVEDLEMLMITEALKTTNGNRVEAAKVLNIPRTTLHSKLNKYNMYD